MPRKKADNTQAKLPPAESPDNGDLHGRVASAINKAHPDLLKRPLTAQDIMDVIEGENGFTVITYNFQKFHVTL